jgi:hypothetical protein
MNKRDHKSKGLISQLRRGEASTLTGSDADDDRH